ncbi:MAG: Transposase [Thermoanaerobacterium thermosaccharolyticum]|jgi:hypothetical protein
MKKEVIRLNKTQIDIYKSIRGDWGDLSPVTRVVNSKKAYNRSKQKQKVRQQMQAYLY